jgi:hypothetical protein
MSKPLFQEESLVSLGEKIDPIKIQPPALL